MQRLDAWGFEAGLTFDHIHAAEADHVGLRTSDDKYVGLYDDARLTISADDINIDTAQIRKIEKIVLETTSRFRRFGKLKGKFDVVLSCHVIVKNGSLKRFIQAALTSARSSYLRGRLGSEMRIQGLTALLGNNILISLNTPDDIDVSVMLHATHQGFLRSSFSASIDLLNGLAKRRP